MKQEDLIKIAEGLRLIEKGVETIQGVMREKNMKSIADMAAQLIPVFKEDDDSISESVLKHLE